MSGLIELFAKVLRTNRSAGMIWITGNPSGEFRVATSKGSNPFIGVAMDYGKSDGMIQIRLDNRTGEDKYEE